MLIPSPSLHLVPPVECACVERLTTGGTGRTGEAIVAGCSEASANDGNTDNDDSVDSGDRNKDWGRGCRGLKFDAAATAAAAIASLLPGLIGTRVIASLLQLFVFLIHVCRLASTLVLPALSFAVFSFRVSDRCSCTCQERVR